MLPVLSQMIFKDKNSLSYTITLSVLPLRCPNVFVLTILHALGEFRPFILGSLSKRYWTFFKHNVKFASFNKLFFLLKTSSELA